MARLLGNANSDEIFTPLGVTQGATRTLLLRYTMALSAPANNRFLFHIAQGAGTEHAYLFLESGTNTLTWGFSNSAGGFSEVSWATGWSAGSGPHDLALDYASDSGQLLIFADGDMVSPKAGTSAPEGDRTPDGGTPFVVIGQSEFNTNQSAGGVLSEVAWFPGTTLFEFDRVRYSRGYSPLFLFTKPSHYWPLLVDGSDLVGGLHGTLVGTTLAAHPRIITPSRRQLVGVGS